MRIVSGFLRGRRIHPPSNLPVRPTTDFAREALFNVLGNLVDFESMKVLDLFAGTGSISLEFVSRGCPSVTAVDINTRCTTFIYNTAKEFNLEQLVIRKSTAENFIRQAGQQYDLVFADPPYDLPALPGLPDLILESKVLAPGGIFILEHPRRMNFSTHPRFNQHRSYGNVNFSFFGERVNG